MKPLAWWCRVVVAKGCKPEPAGYDRCPEAPSEPWLTGSDPLPTFAAVNWPPQSRRSHRAAQSCFKGDQSNRFAFSAIVMAVSAPFNGANVAGLRCVKDLLRSGT